MKNNGIEFLSPLPESSGFEERYLKVRLQEKRIYSDQVVAQLPNVSRQSTAHFEEWRARAYSLRQLKKYFAPVNRRHNLMDLGCGNGWASAALAQNEWLNVSAVDVNLEELQQAIRVFRRANLQFGYGNIFEDIFPEASFDFIVLNSCTQYFEDLQALITRLFFFLKKNGEIHLVDTPFYTRENVDAARHRTKEYYTAIGFPEMADSYHHHLTSDLSPFQATTLSDNLFHKLQVFTGLIPANFKWIRIVKT